MLDVGLVGVLAVWVALVAWRALRGAPPERPIRFAVVAGVSVVIHLGFHAAATAAPTLDAVALVLAGWTTFGLWCLWLGRLPSRGFRESEDDSTGEGGGGGGHGPDDDPPDGHRPSDGDGGIDWDAFEREFATYANTREVGAPAH
jgi:hypothetical protein